MYRVVSMQPAEKGKQLKQLLQQVTTLREDKTRYACIQSFCKVNNQNNSFAMLQLLFLQWVTWL